jgi:retron-type reverse transcriptase
MTKLDPRNNIDQIFVDNCIYRLKNIKILKKDHKYRNLTKNFLTDPNFLTLAYLQIKGKQGNMTSSIDKVTLDGMDEKWFINAATKIKNNTYTFKPAKMIEIPKPNSKILRLLTIGTPRDQIIQKAISILLTQIYEYTEKIFLNTSHGFRPGFSPHTALKEIKTK